MKSPYFKAHNPNYICEVPLPCNVTFAGSKCQGTDSARGSRPPPEVMGQEVGRQQWPKGVPAITELTT